MTRREKLIKAIEHVETEQIPYYADFTDVELRKMVEYTGNKDFKHSFGSYIDWINLTDFRMPVNGKPGFVKDEFGVVWDVRDADIGVVAEYVLKGPTLKDYKFPLPDEKKICENMETILSNGRDTFKMINVGFTLFERAWSMIGMENLLIDMLEEEEFVFDLLNKITEYNLAVMDIAIKYKGFDAFYFGDDWGQQRGLIMGPDNWRKYLKPGIAKVFEYSKKHGKYNVFHSCGDISQLFPELIDIGLDVYETFQPEIYDIRETKRVIGNKLTFLGGVSTQSLLPFAKPSEVKSAMREIMDIMGKGGGYIVAPTHAVPGDVPPENVMAMIEVFKSMRI
jgi:uroporphyrinogen decarboxylase